MMYREHLVPAPDLNAHVVEAAATSRPLGAYATQARAYYLFLEADARVSAVVAPLHAGAELPACAPELPLFEWDEREMRDERGVPFSGVTRRPAETGGPETTVAVVGPVHAGIIEPGRFTFSTGGESIERLDVELHFSRRNVELAFEGRDAAAVAPLVARICGGCSVARSLAYANALEALAGVSCDEPAELARLVVAELERIYNHLFDLASSAAGAGYGRAQFGGLRLKERAMQVNRAHAGHRLLFDAVVPGGVAPGVVSTLAALRFELKTLREEVARYIERFFAADSFVSRLKETGTVSAATARAYGAVGPALRATGETFDVRTAAPYGAYRELRPLVAHANAGDAYARCRVKADELLESFALALRALDRLGNHAPGTPKRVVPRAGRTVAVTEGPRGAEVVAVECDDAGALRRFHAISASYRNWPIVVAAMQGNIIPDFPLVNKSFNLCYACADR